VVPVTAKERLGGVSECGAIAVPRRDTSHTSHASVENAVKRQSWTSGSDQENCEKNFSGAALEDSDKTFVLIEQLICELFWSDTREKWRVNNVAAAKKIDSFDNRG